MYLNGGEYNGIRILSRKTIDTILSNQTGDVQDESSVTQFGLAFSILTQIGEEKGGNGSKGTFNWGGYFNTQYYADPVENIILVIMKQTQNAYADNTRWKFRHLVFQSLDD